jgi:CheY-like chemotaxis protein
MGRALRVLIAEDQPLLAVAIQFSLQRAGFAVTIVRDGYEAWDLLQRAAFDLLITEHQMPTMTGAELCRRIRQDPHLAELPIIVLTGKELEPIPEWLSERPDCCEVIQKPFSPRQLVAAVENRLLASTASGSFAYTAPAYLGFTNWETPPPALHENWLS